MTLTVFCVTHTKEHRGLELNSENIKVGSILIYQTERELLTEQDFPEYTNFEFLSDIGKQLDA